MRGWEGGREAGRQGGRETWREDSGALGLLHRERLRLRQRAKGALEIGDRCTKARACGCSFGLGLGLELTT